jgi:hypothetical protein
MFAPMSHKDLLALAAANAPNPSRDIIELFHKHDVDHNPYNEPSKKKWRTEIEIIADYKLDCAEVLFSRLNMRLEEETRHERPTN